jgi:hypothetical protein
MDNPDKNFCCQACKEHANGYCFLYLMNVKKWSLCPDFKPLWEDT